MRCSTGIANARVLPVPVRAWPIRSVPISAMGRVISWIGNGVVMPTDSSASAISGRTPRSVNVDRTISIHAKVWSTQSIDRCRRVRRYAACMSESTTSDQSEIPPSQASAAASSALQDPTYRHAVVDLIGAIAYSELSAFERLAEDSQLAPTLEDKAALAAMASA